VSGRAATGGAPAWRPSPTAARVLTGLGEPKASLDRVETTITSCLGTGSPPEFQGQTSARHGEEPALTDLPDLSAFTAFDERLREVPADRPAIAAAARAALAALAEARAAEDRAAVLRLLGYLGEARRVLGQHDGAVAALEEALALAGELGEARAEVANAIRLAEAHKYRGDLELAETMLRDILARVRAEGMTRYEDFALQHLGKCRLDQGDAVEAMAYLEAALALRREKGDPGLIASTEQALARARRMQTGDRSSGR